MNVSDNSSQEPAGRQQTSQEPIRRAVLVIHGIGQQRRFETLSDFTLGLIRNGLPQHLRCMGSEILADLERMYRDVGIELFQDKMIRLKGGVGIKIGISKLAKGFESFCRLFIPGANTGEPGTEIDIYEAYWAQRMGGRTNFFRVMLWLIVTAFKGALNSLQPSEPHTLPPSRFRKETDGGAGTPLPDSRPRLSEFMRRAWGFVKDLCRLIGIVVILVGILVVLYYAGRELWIAFGKHGSGLNALDSAHNFIRTLLVLTYIFLALEFLGGLAVGKVRQPWYLSLAMAALLVVAGVFVFRGMATLLGDIWSLILLFVVIWLANTVFVKYLGDVEVYTSGSEIVQNYDVRRAIIDDTWEKLDYILYGKTVDKPFPEREETPYSDVIVVGHSLGSVIAYDVLCDFFRKERGNEAELARKRIRHLFTAGSPLDKIWYFFRERPNPSNIIHQGILARLKGVKGSGMTDSPLYDLNWTNIWCWTDCVSDKLEMYGDGVVNIHIPSLAWQPLVNHVRYWRSGDVMRRIGAGVFAGGTESS